MKKTIIKLCLILSLVAYPLSARHEVIVFTPFEETIVSDVNKPFEVYQTKDMEKVINDMVKKGYKLKHTVARQVAIYLIFEK